MKLNTFVDALHEAGWEAPHDAQHTEIRKLHAKLFPIIAELEEDLGSASARIRELEREQTK